MPDTTLDQVMEDDFQMVVLPGGGEGAQRLEADERIAKLLHRLHQSGNYTAAICAAPKVLASAGLLAGRQATAYPGTLDKLVGLTLSTAAVVQDGQVITSRGPGTAMDFTLLPW